MSRVLHIFPLYFLCVSCVAFEITDNNKQETAQMFQRVSSVVDIDEIDNKS